MNLTLAWRALQERETVGAKTAGVVGGDKGAKVTTGLGVSRGATGVEAGDIQCQAEAPGPA